MTHLIPFRNFDKLSFCLTVVNIKLSSSFCDKVDSSILARFSLIILVSLPENSWYKSCTNVFLFLVVILLIAWKISFSFSVVSAYAAMRSFSQALAHWNQVARISYLDNHSSKIYKYWPIVLKLLNFVIDTIFAMLGMS